MGGEDIKAEGGGGGAGSEGGREEGGEGLEGVGLGKVRGETPEPQQALRAKDGRVPDRSDGVDRKVEFYCVEIILKIVMFVFKRLI